MPVNQTVKAGILSALMSATAKVTSVDPTAVKLVGKNGVKKVDFISIKKRKGRNIRENLDEWTGRDFAYFMMELFRERYKEDWNVMAVGLTRRMNDVKQALYEQFGFCDNLMLRDYLEYFFENWSDYFRTKGKGELYFNAFREHEPVDDFAIKYDYAEHRHAEQAGVPVKVAAVAASKPKVSKEAMEAARLLSVEKLVLQFGVVLALVYLVDSGMTSREAVASIGNAMISLFKGGMWENVRNVTESFGPYPERFSVVNFEKFYDALSRKTGGQFKPHVDFTKDIDEFPFLRS